LLLSACDSVGYYAQAVQGQTSILLKRQSIDRLLENPELTPELRHKLNVIVEAREFAGQSLGLPADGSYTSYVALDREHMVWNVFAAPAFALEPLTWCFPVAGCVGYRGYFSETAARAFADRLGEQGYDVYVGGVDAYSTLGWFKDPVPSTIIRRADHRLAGLIFHELAHQRLYAVNDTAFNESFASFVEQEGLRRWSTAIGTPEQFERYQREASQHQRFIDLVMHYRERFAELYASGLEVEQMAVQKQALQQAMREDWAQRENSEAYAHWFAGPLNNAQLSTVGAYYHWVPAFARVMARSGGDLEQFYAEVATLVALPPAQRLAQLNRLME
jgi:predicted aminopeptidase